LRVKLSAGTAAPDIGGVWDFETFRYERLVVSVVGGRVTAWGTTDDRARTPEGVGIGDTWDLVERSNPNADCFIQNEGTEYVTYPICKVRVCSGRLLGFGDEPIKSIWLAAGTNTALRTCRHRR